MSGLLQLSGIIVDLVYRVDHVPLAGEEAIVSAASMSAGGGFNAMVAARRSGMPTTYGGGLGDGPLSNSVLKQLHAQDISIIQQPQTNQDQGCCTVLIDASGERTFIAKEGAEGIVTNEQLASIDANQFDWVLISGYALVYEHSRDAIAAWINKLPSTSRLLLDPCPLIKRIDPSILDKVMARCTWVSCNAMEAQHLTGQSNAQVAAKLLADRLPGNGGAIVRQGEAGCTLAYHKDKCANISGFSVNAIDTNGAGDAHIGCFIANMSGGMEPREACIIANAAAALSTTVEGPATAPSLDEAKMFVSNYKNINKINQNTIDKKNSR